MELYEVKYEDNISRKSMKLRELCTLASFSSILY